MRRGALARQLRTIGAILGLGAAWGIVLGLWFVAPSLIDAHRLAPRTPVEWLVTTGTLVAISAVIGAELTPLAAILLTLSSPLRRRCLKDARAAVVFLAPTIAAAYFVAAALVEWGVAKRSPLVMPSAYLQPAIGIMVLAVAAEAMHRAVGRAARRGLRPLFAGMSVVAVLGAAALPFRVQSHPTSTVSEAGAVVPTHGRTARAVAPLLLVGIDSGNWESIVPLLRSGTLPTFARLIDGGLHGDVEALWPPFWSGPAWSAILTGHPREETGIYGDLMGFAPGLPPFDVPLTSSVLLNPYLLAEWKLLDFGAIRVVPSPRTALGRPPVWELVSRAGASAGVVRMDFTHPPAGQADVVISNHAGRDIWRLAKVTVGTDLVAPAALQDALLAPFSDDVPFDTEGFARILPPSNRPRSARVRFELGAVESAYDIDGRTVDAAVALLHRRPDLEFLGVYLGGFDNVCHAMWQYRFPEAYGDAAPPASDVKEFRGVIDRYLVFLDASLARLVAAYPREPNVIVVSDHGHTASLAALDQPLWRGWHGRIGIFVAHGPGVPASTEKRRVSYFDVVPTILDLLGFEIPTGLHGVPLARPAPPR